MIFKRNVDVTLSFVYSTYGEIGLRREGGVETASHIAQAGLQFIVWLGETESHVVQVCSLRRKLID